MSAARARTTTPPATRRAVAALALALVAALGGVTLGAGCAVRVEGSFDDVPFLPDTTAIALYDKHDFLLRSGGIFPVEKPRPVRTVSLLLSGAQLDPDVQWRTQAGLDLLETRLRLAREDLLFIDGLDVESLRNARTLTATLDTHNRDTGADGAGSGDFRFALGQRALDDDQVAESGLGGLITVTVSEGRFEEREPRGGHLTATITVTRARAFGQPSANLAIGDVVLQVSLPFSGERLTKSNFGIAGPIAFCRNARGPDTGTACWQTPAEPDVDEAGVGR